MSNLGDAMASYDSVTDGINQPVVTEKETQRLLESLSGYQKEKRWAVISQSNYEYCPVETWGNEIAASDSIYCEDGTELPILSVLDDTIYCE